MSSIKTAINLCKKLALAATLALSWTSLTFGQGTITDSPASFSFNAGGFSTAPSGNFSVPTPGLVDHLFEQGWWFRIAGDSAETVFPEPTSQGYFGNTAIIDWVNVSGRNFDAQLIATIKSGGPNSARVQLEMTVTNNTGATLVIDLFHMADFDVQNTSAGDSAILVAGNNYIRIADPTLTFAEYRGLDANSYMVRPFGATDLGAVLGNASVDNLNNTGLPLVGDFTGAFQHSYGIGSGGSIIAFVILAVNEPANFLVEACVLPDFSCSSFNQPNCETAGGTYFADANCGDTDADGRADIAESCPLDPGKFEAGVCGCGVADTDSDADGVPNCNDSCSADPAKIEPLVCGCGVADADSDGDASLDCNDSCPVDSAKLTPGICGCGVTDADVNANGITDCLVTPELKAKVSAVQALAKKIKLVSTDNKKKLKAQKLIRSRAKALSLEVVSFVTANASLLTLSNPALDVNALAKVANAKIKKAARGNTDTFLKDRKAALKAVATLLGALAA